MVDYRKRLDSAKNSEGKLRDGNNSSIDGCYRGRKWNGQGGVKGRTGWSRSNSEREK